MIQELEYLCDMSIITPSTLSELLSQIPPQTALHAPISVGAVPTANPTPGAPQPPTSPMQNMSMNEKQQQNNGFYAPSPQPTPAPPPAYGAAAAPPPSMAPLAQATALYAYSGTDPGDLSLQPNDHITVTEYMNAEWWKGHSSRTGQEGIFPRSYVKVVEDKQLAQQQNNGGSSYGNMPLEVSGAGDGSGKVPGKGEEMGKKFGKKVRGIPLIHPLCCPLTVGVFVC